MALHKNFINGEWLAGTGTKENINPSDVTDIVGEYAQADKAQTEAAIRALLGRAARDLARANPASLTSDQRAQFDTARRFLQQAEEALKVRNLVYAGKLADKAATLSAVFAR